MYYSAGTYESFAHPEKPQGVDNKSAYIIGTGLAGLTAAFYLVRDGQMKGERIHLLEKLDLAGGSCDGRKDVTKGYYMRGGREMPFPSCSLPRKRTWRIKRSPKSCRKAFGAPTSGSTGRPCSPSKSGPAPWK